MPLTTDEQEALWLHNQARQEIKEDKRPDLVWDSTLAAFSLEYGIVLGENLAFRSGGLFSLADASKAWIEEKFKYHGEKIGSGGDSIWGHYTEIIWQDVTNVDIASARTRFGATYVVARYNTCQTKGRAPSSLSNGKIFEGRDWEPIGRVSNQSLPKLLGAIRTVT